MNKSLIAAASATFALAALASSTADAGFKIHFGFGHHVFLGGGFHHHWHPRYVVRTPVQPRAYVARKAKPVSVAEEEPVTTVAVVNNENSSIAVASADVAEGQTTDSVEKTIVKPDKTAVAAENAAKVAEAAAASEAQPSKKLDCKKFFPSVGLTLTAPCE